MYFALVWILIEYNIGCSLEDHTLEKPYSRHSHLNMALINQNSTQLNSGWLF